MIAQMHAVVPTAAYPPGFAPLITDTITIQGGILSVVRDHNEIVRINLNQYSTLQDQPFFFGSAPFNNIFWVKKMPGITNAITAVHRNTSTGVVTVAFSSGNSRELQDWNDASQIADGIDSSETLSENILIARSYRMSPDGSNLTTQVGAQCSVNLLADQPIVYTEAS